MHGERTFPSNIREEILLDYTSVPLYPHYHHDVYGSLLLMEE